MAAQKHKRFILVGVDTTKILSRQGGLATSFLEGFGMNPNVGKACLCAGQEKSLRLSLCQGMSPVARDPLLMCNQGISKMSKNVEREEIAFNPCMSCTPACRAPPSV